MAHYWRGLIDADGSIILGPGWGLSLVGTESIVTAFGDWARTIDPSIASQPRRSKSIWEFRIGGRHQARTVAKALYEGCRVALPRKAQRAAELITTPPRVESPLGTVSVSITSARGGYQPHGTTGYGRGCRCSVERRTGWPPRVTPNVCD